jgi:hypothetical protein
MNMPNQVYEKFREIFLHHLSVIHNKDLDHLARIEDTFEIRRMIIANDVPRIIVLKTILESLKLYPISFNYIFESFLRFIMTDESNKEQTGVYPELMWILYSSEFFADDDSAEKMSDITRTLVYVVGHNFARSYLNYRLVSSSKDEAKIIIHSYYYTRHDIDSLRLISEAISYNDPNLSDDIYRYGLDFVSNHAEQPILLKDFDFLVEFFHQGLTNESETIRNYCERALKKLKQS